MLTKNIMFFSIYFLTIGCNSKRKNSVGKSNSSFKKKGDILLDSLFISIPSEGTIVEVFDKGKNEKLYVSNSIATMNKYIWEIYDKKDSTFVIERIKNYNQPLSIPGAKLESEIIEYVSCYKNKIILFVRNDTIIKNQNEIFIKNKEIKHIKQNILLEN